MSDARNAPTLHLDGEESSFTPDETIFEVAERHRRRVREAGFVETRTERNDAVRFGGHRILGRKAASA